MTINEKIKKLNEKSLEFQLWYYILKKSPTNEWEKPVKEFIKKLMKTKIRISKKDIERCVYFMHNIAMYIYAKNIDNESIKGSIKNEMKKATTLAKQGKRYRPDIIITKQFKQKLNGDIPENLRWGLCAVLESIIHFDGTLERATKTRQKDIIKNAVVEQLIPNDWKPDPAIEAIYHDNEKDKWNIRKVKKAVNTIGNFLLIEKSIHKNTSKIIKGDFLTKRKNIPNGYKNSIFGVITHMCEPITPLWNETPLRYPTYQTKQKHNVLRLIWFFFQNPK